MQQTESLLHAKLLLRNTTNLRPPGAAVLGERHVTNEFTCDCGLVIPEVSVVTEEQGGGSKGGGGNWRFKKPLCQRDV